MTAPVAGGRLHCMFSFAPGGGVFIRCFAVFVAALFAALPVGADTAPHERRTPESSGAPAARSGEAMNGPALLLRLAAAMACSTALLSGCGGSDDAAASAPVAIDAGTPNTISRWNEAAAATINQANATSGTPEETNSQYAFDLATVHVAMYDAVVAIAGGYQPFYVMPHAHTEGASQDAAAAAAAYGVLKGLFPSRSATYQALYDSSLAAVADPAARDQGVAVGAEVASAVLSIRANDGRNTALPAFVAGTGPGQFRGPALVGRTWPYVRPFALLYAGQFRAPGAPALTSAAYAADFNETKALGGAVSTTRTAAQATSARFHSEAPGVFWSRNLRPFLMTNRSLADNARVGAQLWVTHADATIACMESKYALLAWRPFSAINFADTDGNAATDADPAWKPFLPTPPHPEYPAAHGCAGGSMAETFKVLFGTSDVSFDFTSNVTSSSQHYATPQDLLDDITIARIAGGMHFRFSIVDGEALGKSVADYVSQAKFKPR